MYFPSLTAPLSRTDSVPPVYKKLGCWKQYYSIKLYYPAKCSLGLLFVTILGVFQGSFFICWFFSVLFFPLQNTGIL